MKKESGGRTSRRVRERPARKGVAHEGKEKLFAFGLAGEGRLGVDLYQYRYNCAEFAPGMYLPLEEKDFDWDARSATVWQPAKVHFDF